MLDYDGNETTDEVMGVVKKVEREGLVTKYFAKKKGSKLFSASPTEVHNRLTYVDPKRGARAFQFHEITEGAYNWYVKYVETKDPKFLTFAEREIKV